MTEKVTVVRGPDWMWGTQDGGEGSTGTVVKVFRRNTFEGEKRYLAKTAIVRWTSGSTNVYRVGVGGSYDLRILDNSGAGVKHDGVKCDACGEENVDGIRWKCVECYDYDLCTDCYMGDKHNLDHEFWRYRTPGSERVKVSKRRNATKIDRKKSISSDTPGEALLLLLFKEVLSIGPSSYYRDHLPLMEPQAFDVGDKVKIDTDVEKIKSQQKGHGGWNDKMAEAAGKTGEVVKVFPDEDLKVLVNGNLWTYNPACVKRVDDDDDSSILGGDKVSVIGKVLGSVLSEILEKNTSTDGPSSSSENKSELETLIERKKESINELNEDGDAHMHVAAACDNDDAAKILLKHGADMNKVNSKGLTPLHVAVNNGSTKCARLLLARGCDVDICDSDGNTALHAAINAQNSGMVEILLAHSGTNCRFKNNRGYNAFHQAAYVGNHFAVKEIIRKFPNIINEMNDDENTALHLSVRRGHFKVTDILLKQDSCEVDVRNSLKETPLLVAAKMGRCAEVELLVFLNANINAEDGAGNTALHLALLNQRVEDEIDVTNAPTTSTVLSKIGKIPGVQKSCGLAIACYLAQKGCNLEHKNHLGKTAMDYVISTVIRDLLLEFASKAPSTESGTEPVKLDKEPEEDPSIGECILCSEDLPLVLLEPCGHQVACVKCCSRMKKCIVCRVELTKKEPQTDGTAQSSPRRGTPESSTPNQKLHDVIFAFGSKRR